MVVELSENLFSTKHASDEINTLETQINATVTDDYESARKDIGLEPWQSTLFNAISRNIGNSSTPDSGTNTTKIAVCAYKLGLKIFRDKMAERLQTSNHMMNAIENVVNNSPNSSPDFGNEHSDRGNIITFNDELEAISYTPYKATDETFKTEKLRVDEEDLGQVAQNYASNLFLGGSVHRLILMLGMSRSEILEDNYGEFMRQYINEYYKSIDYVITKRQKIMARYVTKIVYHEWGPSGIPDEYKDDVEYLWKNIDDDYLSSDQLEHIDLEK